MPTLDELTDPAAVRRAIALHDKLGDAEFLRRYGFGRARRFWLEFNGKRYASKAIAGVAWGLQHARGTDWLKSADFSGGDATVRRRLEALGFRVIDDGGPNPATTTGRNAGSAGSAPTHNTWIFQANPDAFDIGAYLATRPADFLWLARQKAADMQIGDRVFLWRAIGRGSRASSGVIAEAEIGERPQIQPEDAGARAFWRSSSGTDNPLLPQTRARLRLLRVAEGANVLQRDALAAEPELAGMQVLTGRTGTNFLLKPEEADALSALWAGAKTIAIAASTTADDVGADIAAIEADPTIPPTTRLALIEARRGQGQFRARLMHRWQSACAATGITVTQILRASHIRPWRDATNAERLDPNNGLLLAAHLDALFDAGLISFQDDGTTLVSAALSPADCSALGLPTALRDALNATEQAYLAHHRTERFQP